MGRLLPHRLYHYRARGPFRAARAIGASRQLGISWFTRPPQEAWIRGSSRLGKLAHWSWVCKNSTFMRKMLAVLGLVIPLSMSIGGCGGDDDGAGETVDGSPTGGDGSPGGDAGDVDAGGGDDAAAGEFAVQIIRPSCAPNDGPAVRILLGAESDDECAVSEEANRLDLQIWASPAEIEAPAIFSFAPGESNGAAQLCSGGNESCRSFETGSITLTVFRDGVDAAGTFALSGEGTDISGGFEATWCTPDPPEPCG